ncbi:DUF429 domain-containing protein [uncultured Serinicoccus sp.]|uniref:DUF429 domain-containing protein n=1 Tax=uncultured Serinicoccus sp. TaxID=735514 RepID=UPI00263825D5|nr:DUF429 domain-containing protein [uncultured Serinicoccus sp.]
MFVGIDLAWNDRARTGLAALDDDGRLVASASVRSNTEIDTWLDRHTSDLPDVVAVDAPLIVTNPDGQRPCERMITAAFGRYDAGCHASNLSKPYFDPPRAQLLADRRGWNPDPGSNGPGVCLEVYPHPAMVGLFHLGRILPYKGKGGRTVEVRRAATLELLDRMEGLDQLEVVENERWLQLRRTADEASRPMHLDGIEDEIDAIFCAYLAWSWRHRREDLEVYGDTTSGYIVAPPPPTHPTTPRVPRPAPRASGDADHLSHVSVSFSVSGQPATFATAGERAWRDLVELAAVEAMGGRPTLRGRLSVHVDFVTAQRHGKHPGWDLDNLIKPTIDALTPVIGPREGQWTHAQPDDERVDEIIARKRPAEADEQPGARIVVSEMAAHMSGTTGHSPAMSWAGSGATTPR